MAGKRKGDDSLDNPDFFSAEEQQPTRFKEGMYIPLIGWVGRFGRKKSLYTLLMVAAHIDRREDRREVQEIRALAARTKTLRKVSASRIDEFHEEIADDLAPDRIDRLAEFTTRKLRSDDSRRRESAFMHALDILYADQTLTDTEKQFIKDLARWLNIEPERSRELVEVLKVKNAH